MRCNEGIWQYTYDANGNLTSDDRKQITHIKYNHLNLPEEVTLAGPVPGTIYYLYTADGVKLRKRFDKVTGTDEVTEYVGGVEYVNETLSRIATPEGFARTGSGFVFYYNITDHLGNVRITVDGSGGAIQRDDYYPFGGTFNSYVSGTQNLYKYQGKEEQEELDTYDFEARMYDPWVARTWQLDPLADKYYSFSPYSWVANNPISLTDLTGMEIDLSGLDRKDRRLARQSLRKHNSSDTYRNLYKQLKKSDARYVVKIDRSGEMGLAGGIFVGNNIYTLDDEVDPSTGEVIKGMQIQDYMTQGEFGMNEKGGIITLNGDLSSDPDDLGDFAVEEVVHAAQYDEANKDSSLPTSLGATANMEFEAKTIVGQIASESNAKMWTSNPDKIANGYGRLAFKTGAVNEKQYFHFLKEWHSAPKNPYSDRRISTAKPSLLKKLVTK